MSVRRWSLRVLVLFSVVAGCLGMGVAVASAAITHEYLSQITEVPAGAGASLPGPFVSPAAMTVDNGELYVADHLKEESGLDRSSLDRFSASSGAFVSQFPQAPSPLGYLHQSVAVGHVTGE